MHQSNQQAFSFCETLFLEGRILKMKRKKSGRYSSIQLQTSLGHQSIKVSKYFRVSPGYCPSVQDGVLIKVFRKINAGKEKLTAFEMRPLTVDELKELTHNLCPLSPDGNSLSFYFVSRRPA
ncbi:MAG: hypothetical protein HC810_00125 [Acaryochloridaceae cyanobacterium RL_2_7]|nr:hypothetical protein [Acaryochloridaceae cyanobacterium RL_2_7]